MLEIGDEAHITRALELAGQALHLSNPNPRVGCVLCSPAGEPIGEGHTQAAGGPHAEAAALADARARGLSTDGATAYVTLEPCSHTGRTGPCVDALVEAGIRRVVASIEDPNPLVAGKGFERLRSAGIQVDIGPGAQESRELNIGFFSRMIRRQPWVRMKIAASLDGLTALPDGRSQWITSEAARADGHQWRARACAVLSGVGTVLEDNPRLSARVAGLVRQPHRVVVDSELRTPAGAALFGHPGRVWIYAARGDAQREAELKQSGAEISCMADSSGKVDLAAMLGDLARREVNELHVEAGHKLNGSLLKAGLVDELLLYLAPTMLGQGRALAALEPPPGLDHAPRWAFREHLLVGNDLRLLARIPGRDSF